MLPVAALPVASIFMGIGYWIDPSGWGGESVIAAFLIKSGGALIDNMGILFAVGVFISSKLVLLLYSYETNSVSYCSTNIKFAFLRYSRIA